MQGDYLFLSRDGHQTGPDRAMITVFVICDDKGACESCIAHTKGAAYRYVVKVAARFIDSLGAEQVLFRADSEMAIQSLSRAIANE